MLEKRVAIQSRADLLTRLFDENVKVIANHHIDDDTQTEEAFELARQCDNMLFASPKMKRLSTMRQRIGRSKA